MNTENVPRPVSHRDERPQGQNRGSAREDGGLAAPPSLCPAGRPPGPPPCCPRAVAGFLGVRGLPAGCCTQTWVPVPLRTGGLSSRRCGRLLESEGAWGQTPEPGPSPARGLWAAARVQQGQRWPEGGRGAGRSRASTHRRFCLRDRTGAGACGTAVPPRVHRKAVCWCPEGQGFPGSVMGRT